MFSYQPNRWRGRWEKFWELAVDGGPPVRGQKLLAWRVPPVYAEGFVSGVAGAMAPPAQGRLFAALRLTVAAVAADVCQGLMQTVGAKAAWTEGERACVTLFLPEGCDTEYIARAIDLENVEAWRNPDGAVQVGIGPFYTTKDIDQTVLAITKVLHVHLGMHGPATADHTHL